MTDAPDAKAKFPRTFWTANVIELFERAAYYSMASFMVIFLVETLGMRPATATLLNGTVLWGLIYFLPIVSGTLADKFGFRRSLTVSFVLIALGYLILGNLQKVWPGLIGAKAGAAIDFTVPVVLGIVLVGIGGSIVKPCIAGTIQKTSGQWKTLGFGIFYMVINIGSITGRSISYIIRTNLGIPAIFTYAASAFALIGLVVTALIYREPQYVADGKPDAPAVKKRTVGEALLGIFVVLGNIRFVFFIIVISLFWFLYIQLYNLMPLYMRHLDPNAPMDLYTLANPIMIVAFQLLITKISKKWKPIRSILVGVGVTTVFMLLNVVPALLPGGLTKSINLGLVIPVAGVFLILSIASMAVGEMFASPRIYEYIGSIAPKGQEGLFMGYANLPLALASMIGGPIGGRLFEIYVKQPAAAGKPVNPAPMWLIIGGIGLVSLVGLFIYDSWLKKAAKA
ncbi:MAG: MFS transporter [Acidobacteriota bacterium]|nr:MFS transporter [Acidobacteriota bacterium]